MSYFKDENTNEVYAYDQDQIDGGWVKEGLVAMTEEEIQAHLNPVIPVVVPSKVTMRQARLALLQEGLLDQVETLLASLEGPEGQAARIEWDYSSEVHRTKPFVVMLGTQLGLTEEQMDDLFIKASNID